MVKRKLTKLEKWGRPDYPERIEDDDCPVFVIKAKDNFVHAALIHYEKLCRNHGLMQLAAQVRERLQYMMRWRSENIGKLKYPDLPLAAKKICLWCDFTLMTTTGKVCNCMESENYKKPVNDFSGCPKCRDN